MSHTHNFHHLDHDLPPTILTIFGATGDLSSDYLIPALLHMESQDLLPKNFRLVCVGRKNFTTEEYLKFMVKKSSVLKRLSARQKSSILNQLTYFRGDFDNVDSFASLAKILDDSEKPKHACHNRLYYFATSPQYFASIARILQETGLLSACARHDRKVRILVEKPFGFNLKSAESLNRLLLKFFSESQIYRIDHYLGKETVQNLMVARFANSIFEPLWNSHYIDHVEISVLENDRPHRRAAYYDQTGALRDMVQNHMLQMLALLAMDEPKNLTADFIRDEKVKILRSLVPFSVSNVDADLLQGQYAGYKKDVGNSESRTETYIALKAHLHSPRWFGVPFYLRTGKALHKKLTELSIHFKEPARCLFAGCGPNVLTFRIQPDESLHLQVNNKIPGFGVELTQGDYEFGYQKTFRGQIPSAYERLLLDFIEGDQRLFIRSDEIEAAWAFVDSVTESLFSKPARLHSYKPGASGPKEAGEWIKKDNKEFWTK